MQNPETSSIDSTKSNSVGVTEPNPNDVDGKEHILGEFTMSDPIAQGIC